MGSCLFVVLWLPEGRGRASSRKRQFRPQGTLVLGGCAAGKVQDRQAEKGCTGTVCRTRKLICPVVALLEFMVIRKAGDGPFFRLDDGKGLNRRVFVEELRKALRERGMADEGISGHNFKIGAATAASRNGASDEQIKDLDRWRSRAYKGYVRTGCEAQAASAKKLSEVGNRETKTD